MADFMMIFSSIVIFITETEQSNEEQESHVGKYFYN